MHCSSCETMLDRYLDGALSPRWTASVAAHLRTCVDCSALLEEVKVVDGLLATVKRPPLPENFTFAVLAHARTMPVPQPRRISAVAVLTFYVIAAWIASAWLFAAWRNPLFASAANVAAIARSVAGPLGALTHGYGSIAPFAVPVAAIMLMIDIAVFIGCFYAYRAWRPRLG